MEQLFFNKRSQLVSGVEEEKSSVALGQKVRSHSHHHLPISLPNTHQRMS